MGVKHSILTPIYSKRNTFWYTIQSIISKIIKIVATSRQIFRQEAPNLASAAAPPQTPLDTVNAQNILGFIRDIGLYRLL